MTTVNATALPDIAAVRLVIAGAPAGPVIITRSDVSGNGAVRLMPGQEPLAGSMTITDYEPALTGTITYTVLDSSEDEATDTATLAGLITNPVLVVAVRPQYRVEATAVVGYDHTRETAAVVHNPLGRTDPIVVFGALRNRQGAVSMFAATFADAKAIENVVATGDAVLLRQVDHAGMDGYFIATSSNVSVFQAENETVLWQVSVEFVSVDAPDMPLLGAAGWTWADVIENYATVADMQLAFATFNELTVGP